MAPRLHLIVQIGGDMVPEVVEAEFAARAVGDVALVGRLARSRRHTADDEPS